MHRSRLSTIVIDSQVADIDRAATFWGRALNKKVKPVSPDSPNYRDLEVTDEELIILIQRVDHESRVHLDIETDDVEAEVKRLEALGAKRIQLIKTWWVMEAPTGQRFCVIRPQRGPLTTRVNLWRSDGAPVEPA